MNKEQWEKRIKDVEESLERATTNRDEAVMHIEEGETVLAAFREKLSSL